MTRWVRCFLPKALDSLSSMSGTYIIERENRRLQVVLRLSHLVVVLSLSQIQYIDDRKAQNIIINDLI